MKFTGFEAPYNQAVGDQHRTNQHDRVNTSMIRRAVGRVRAGIETHNDKMDVGPSDVLVVDIYLKLIREKPH